MDKQIQSFLESNKNSLIKIYSAEREKRGDGILQITKNIEKETIDVVYFEMAQIPKELVEDINKRLKATGKTNIIFFLVSNGEDKTLLQIELQR